jgi:Flp pilus assembly protein TadG
MTPTGRTKMPTPSAEADSRVRAAPRRCHGEQGSAATELAIVMPVLMLLVLASVHLGLWFHARHLVNASAQEGARAARALGATDADGDARAQQMLTDLGTGSVTHPTITISRTSTTVTVTVTGESPAVIPGLVMSVSASSTSPIEAFRSE